MPRLYCLLLLCLLPLAASAAVSLDQTQRTWVAEHEDIRVGVRRGGWPPFDVLDKDGQHRGLSGDYLALLGQRLGLRFQLVLLDDWDAALKALHSGQIDLLPSVARTAEREALMGFSNPYITSSSLIFTRSELGLQRINDLAGKRVAIERGYVLQQALREQVAGVRLLEVADTEAALRAVSSGRADAYVGDMIVASHLIRELNLTNLELRGEAGLSSSELHFAVRPDWPQLVQLLNQALDDLSSSEQEAIKQRWLPPLTAFNWRRLLTLGWPYLLGLLALVIFVLVWNRRLAVQIAERQRAEVEASRQRSTLLALINAIPDPIWFKDGEGRYLGINQACAELFGLPSDAVRGLRDEMLLDPTWAAARAERDSIARSQARPFESEGSSTYPDGRQVVFDTLRTTFHDEHGRLLGLVGISRNITARKQAEKAMAEAKELAEEAARLKSDFLANMSHEIRTPMNAIIGMSHLVLKTELSQRQRDYLNKIQQSGQHLLAIINDILDFSKIEAGKLSIERIDFDLQQVLDNLVNLIGDKVAAKGLELVFTLDPQLPQQLVGDPLRLGQILINFANNAVKFTEQGEVEVILRAEQRDADQLQLYLGVRDTGIGLTAEQAGRLFESFQQADTSTTRKYGGTGLGLAISKNLAEAMHGSVGVESQLGQGSLFWCRVPLGIAREQAPQAGRRSADEVGTEAALLKPLTSSPRRDEVTRRHAGDAAVQGLRGSEQIPNFSSLRVLLVEDNELNREVACGLLQESGLQIDQAEHGGIALELLRSHADGYYALVLMDMQMPVLDGISTTQAIRREVRFAGLPIIAMTANVMPADRERCLAAGMNDHLGKPIEPSELWPVLGRWLPAQVEPRVDLPSVAETAANWQLPGVDIDSGLRRVLGKRELYQRLLGKFALSQSDFPAQLRAALAANQLHNAEYLAHSLKGLAGNLGAVDLAAQAAALESAIKDARHDELDSLLVELEQSLDALVAAINAQFPAPAPDAVLAVEGESLQALCLQLQQLFADDDPRAVKVFDEQAEVLHSAFNNDYAALAAAVRVFDLEQALVLLRAAAAERQLLL